jgi:uncharacterized tellurite resistance protein B-like protein
MVIHSSFSDFILFLYVHVAHIDNTYDPKEIASIKSKMGRLFPDGTDIERKLYQTIREYNTFDRNNINELIRDSFAFFSEDSETQKTKLFEDVKSIIEADGHVNEQETEIFRAIKRIVDTHVENV